MKKTGMLLLCIMVTTFGVARADERPSVTVYVSPDKLEHPVRISLLPYYSHWVELGDVAARAAVKIFGGQYPNIGLCENGKTSDLIVWINPKIKLNPGVEKVFAEAQVSLHLGDGRLLGKYKGAGEHRALLRSVFMDDAISQAVDDAMKDAATQFADDAVAQQVAMESLSKGITPIACGFLPILGQSKNSD